jgi:hypothetical protein
LLIILKLEAGVIIDVPMVPKPRNIQAFRMGLEKEKRIFACDKISSEQKISQV